MVRSLGLKQVGSPRANYRCLNRQRHRVLTTRVTYVSRLPTCALQCYSIFQLERCLSAGQSRTQSLCERENACNGVLCPRCGSKQLLEGD